LNLFEKPCAARVSVPERSVLNACMKFLRGGSDVSLLPRPMVKVVAARL